MELHIEVLVSLSDASDDVIVSFAFDRVAGNWRVVGWFWHNMAAADSPPNIYPHGEPCSLHGGALVKRAPRIARDIETRCHSYSAWMGNWRNSNEVRDVTALHVESKYRRERSRRPAACEAQNREIVSLVYPHLDDEREAPAEDGRQHGGRKMKSKKSLKQALQDLQLCVDLGYKADGDVYTHWCWITEISPGSGPIGAPCCRNDRQGLEKCKSLF